MTVYALLSFYLLAQTGTDPATTVTQAVPTLIGLMALIVIGNQVMNGLINFRKLKGADPVDEHRYASKAEHQALREEVITIKTEVSGLSRTLTNEFSSLNRSIGVLEGMLKKMKQD